MNHDSLHILLLALANCLSLPAVMAGEYTDSTATGSQVQLSELSVSAIKYGSHLDEEAVSSTSIGRRSLEIANISDTKSASYAAPNFYIPDYGSRMTSTIYVRGMGARMDNPVVGLNIDNVPIMSKDNYDLDMLDIDLIEMIRGAQGALFGRNTMGGLINVYTLSPLSYQGFRAIGSYSSANTYRIGASYYTKIGDKFGISANVGAYSSDGFFTNLNNGEKCDKEKQLSSRLKFQWRLSPNVSLSNVVSLTLVRQGGYPYEYIKTGEINYNDTCFYRRTTFTDGLTVNASLGKISLSSITSFQHSYDNMTLDQDFLPLSYFTLTQAKHENTVTQDFIVKGSTDWKYDWLCGVFGFYKGIDMSAPVTFLDYGISQLIEANVNNANKYYPIRWDSRNFVLGSDFNTKNFGISLYHRSSYKLHNVKFTAGLRIDYENVTLDYNSHSNTGYDVLDNYDPSAAGGVKHSLSSDGWWNGLPVYAHHDVNIDDLGHLSKSFWQVLPKISATYYIPGSNGSSIYASVAKSYKAGGFNTQMFSDVLQQRIMNLLGIGSTYKVDDIISYKPEQSWTLELGGHTDLFSNRLSIDATAFFIICSDQQLTVFPDGTTTGRIMTNAGKTRNWGVELSLNARPTDQLELKFSYGYTNAHFIEFNNGKENFSGKVIPYAPQNTIFASAGYTFPIRKSWLQNVVVGADVQGVGKIYWDEANTISQNLYALLGAFVRFERRNLSVDFWGKNITDTSYRTFYFVSLSNAFLQHGRPRQLGVTLRVKI